MNLYFYEESNRDAPIVYLKCVSSSQTIYVGLVSLPEHIYPGGLPQELPDFIRIVSSYKGIDYILDERSLKAISLNSILQGDGNGLDFQVWTLKSLCDNGVGFLAHTISDLISVYPHTQTGKFKHFGMPNFIGMPIIGFNIPFKDSVWEECFLASRAFDLITEGDYLNIQHRYVDEVGIGYSFDERLSLFPSVRLSTIGNLTQDTPITLACQIVSPEGDPIERDMDLFFENINGQLSHNRRTTIKGYTEIRVAAPMMEPGDKIRIKVGVKFFSSISDIELVVE